MLKSLKINNFALIDKTAITFARGLNIITGETGAGKSIFIESLKIISGERINNSIIGKNSDHTTVEAIFDNIKEPLRLFLSECAIEADEDEIIIVRKISRTEKNTILVNGMHITLNMLKKISEFLIDLHGQHEHQNLLRTDKYWQFVDGNDKEINQQFFAYQNCFNEWFACKKENLLLNKRSQEKQQREDFLRWQIDEINNVSPQKNEDTKLEADVKLLANSEKIGKALSFSYEALKINKKSSDAVIDKLRLIKTELEALSALVPQLTEHVNVINDTYYALDDTASYIRELVDNLEYDPVKLDKMNNRLFTLEKLKRKYGFCLDDVFQYYQKAIIELNELENFEDVMLAKQKEESELYSKLMMLADKLSDLRKRRAAFLSEKTTEHLCELGMTHAKFFIQVTKSDEFSLNGNDKISFFFSANSGEKMRYLQKVASGGELSRVALALKSVINDGNSIDTMIFDEIDSGIGGKTGKLVAEKISKLSAKTQILCITHLPQIACYAEQHIMIEKKENEQHTSTVISILNEEERVQEITRMTGIDGINYAGEIAKKLITATPKYQS